jgi:hypothetical protein
MTLSRLVGALALVLAFQVSMPSVGMADEVLDWNAIAVRATLVAPAVPGNLQPRLLSIVHVSIFDAVQGIEHRYVPIHFAGDAPRRASQRAAVVQAAYRALVTLFPAQAAALDSDLAASLAAIALTDSAGAIQRGRDWGDQVALAIVAWRAGDNPPPLTPYLGSTDVGKWRPTPRPDPMNPGAELPGLPMAAPLLGSSPTFVIPTSSTFRPKGPPSLKSSEYTRDFLEVKRVGAIGSVYRTADQTESARFWAMSNPGSIWNRAAASASLRRHLNLSDNARLFALLNIAAADAIFTCWDSKYYFSFWRPVTAIRLAGTDPNPRTSADSAWVPLIVTPPYPDYYSGHQSVSGASQEVLTEFFGKRMGFEAFSEGLPGVVRSWNSFTEAADEANQSRIWAGIHFQFSQRDSRRVAEQIAKYVLKNAAQPVSNLQFVLKNALRPVLNLQYTDR